MPTPGRIYDGSGFVARTALLCSVPNFSTSWYFLRPACVRVRGKPEAIRLGMRLYSLQSMSVCSQPVSSKEHPACETYRLGPCTMRRQTEGSDFVRRLTSQPSGSVLRSWVSGIERQYRLFGTAIRHSRGGTPVRAEQCARTYYRTEGRKCAARRGLRGPRRHQ